MQVRNYVELAVLLAQPVVLHQQIVHHVWVDSIWMEHHVQYAILIVKLVVDQLSLIVSLVQQLNIENMTQLINVYVSPDTLMAKTQHVVFVNRLA